MYGNRRQFMEGACLVAGSALLPIWGQSAFGRPKLGDHPFTLGVASGDPVPDGVVLWTRLAPRPLDPDWGMSPEPVDVRWEVSDDENFKRIVRQGNALARPQSAHSVHVEVDGLRPDRVYFYRFLVGQEQSPVGRTRTSPLPGADIQALRYAYTSCQRYDTNHYAPYRQMVADDPALILFLGDYIYEPGTRQGTVRQHPKEAAHDLPTYRLRHALYKTDPLLQAAHAAAPWMVIWDDHEVENNYGADHGKPRETQQEVLLRRAAAYQAYYEHMPLRRRSVPVGPSMQIYRALDWGKLAQFQFVDGRQYREFMPCSDRATYPGEICTERNDPRRSILGHEQEAWLYDTLRKSPAKWNVLAQQYMMAEHYKSGVPGGDDSWSGYPASRDRLFDVWKDGKVSNPVALGGDIHAFIASELRKTPDSPPISSAFVGGSLASPGKNVDAAYMTENPQVRFREGEKRGYALVDMTAKESRITYKAAANSLDPDSTTSDLAHFVVEDGKPGFSMS